MKWFNNLAIRNKLLVGFGLMLVCLGIVVVTAYTSVTSISEAQETLFYVEFPLTVELVKFRNSLHKDRVILTRLLSAKTPLEKKEYLKEADEMDQDIVKHLDRIQLLSHKVPGLKSNLDELASVLKVFREARNAKTLPLIREGKEEAASLAAVQFGRYEKMIEMLFNLSKISEAHDNDLMKTSGEIARRSNYIVAIVGIIAIFLSIGVIFFLLRSIAGPLKELSAMTERVAYGDLTVDIPSEQRADELGTLQFMFGMMVASLRQITLEIRSVVETLAFQVGLETAEGEEGPVSPELSELGQKLKKLIEEYKI